MGISRAQDILVSSDLYPIRAIAMYVAPLVRTAWIDLLRRPLCLGRKPTGRALGW